MIAHLVLFKFKAGIDRADPRVAEAIAGLDGLPARIAQIRGWEHGPNMTVDEQAWDYGLRALFEDESALHAYFNHPEHILASLRWEPLSELMFCDFGI